jgi:hypothetical protein
MKMDLDRHEYDKEPHSSYGKELLDLWHRLTAAEQARAASIYRCYAVVQGLGGVYRMWIDAIEETIKERADPRPPMTDAKIEEILHDTYRHAPG